jgi:hypothetical protein
MKARQAVRVSRLELDAAKQTCVIVHAVIHLTYERDSSLKNANPARQEQARLEVENAEDDLVQKTEVAITLMKTVLENVGAGFRKGERVAKLGRSRSPLRTLMNS